MVRVQGHHAAASSRSLCAPLAHLSTGALPHRNSVSRSYGSAEPCACSRSANVRVASTSGRDLAPRGRKRALQVQAALFEPPPFKPSKLTVQYLSGTTSLSPAPPSPRCYTLTHNDLTGDLRLSIGPTINGAQVHGFYTRLLRDEVTAHWMWHQGGPQLHVHCHVSGEERWLAPPQLRNYVFRREMTLVLDTFCYAERELLAAWPQLADAPVFIHFQSHKQDLDLVERWGVLGQRTTWQRMPPRLTERLKLLLFGFPANPHQQQRTQLQALWQQQEQQEQETSAQQRRQQQAAEGWQLQQGRPAAAAAVVAVSSLQLPSAGPPLELSTCSAAQDQQQELRQQQGSTAGSQQQPVAAVPAGPPSQHVAAPVPLTAAQQQGSAPDSCSSSAAAAATNGGASAPFVGGSASVSSSSIDDGGPSPAAAPAKQRDQQSMLLDVSTAPVPTAVVSALMPARLPTPGSRSLVEVEAAAGPSATGANSSSSSSSSMSARAGREAVPSMQQGCLEQTRSTALLPGPWLEGQWQSPSLGGEAVLGLVSCSASLPAPEQHAADAAQQPDAAGTTPNSSSQGSRRVSSNGRGGSSSSSCTSSDDGLYVPVAAGARRRGAAAAAEAGDVELPEPVMPVQLQPACLPVGVLLGQRSLR